MNSFYSQAHDAASILERWPALLRVCNPERSRRTPIPARLELLSGPALGRESQLWMGVVRRRVHRSAARYRELGVEVHGLLFTGPKELQLSPVPSFGDFKRRKVEGADNRETGLVRGWNHNGRWDGRDCFAGYISQGPGHFPVLRKAVFGASVETQEHRQLRVVREHAAHRRNLQPTSHKQRIRRRIVRHAMQTVARIVIVVARV